MKSTRDYGSGSIKELVPGAKYRLRISTQPDVLTGIPGRVSETFCGTKKQAQQRLAELVAEHARRGPQTSASVDDLVRRYRSSTNLTVGTIANYDSAWKLLPAAMKRMPAGELTTDELEHLYTRLVSAGESPHVVKHLHTMVRAAYNRGIKWGMFRFNPATLAKAPSAQRKTIKLPSPEAVARLMAVIAADPQMALYLRLLLVTGQRRGEALGLRWSSVSWDTMTLDINTTIDKNGTVRHGTKNTKDRSNPLDPDTMELLAEWREQQAVLARAADTELVADPWVFASDRAGAKPIRGDVMYHRFKKYATAAGIPDAHPHLLRHYFVTYALDAGVELGVVTKIVGHSRVAVTQDVYNRTVTGADRRAVNTIADLSPMPAAVKQMSAFDDPDAIRSAAEGATSLLSVLTALGVSAAAKNYRRLEQRAAAFGIELPTRRQVA